MMASERTAATSSDRDLGIRIRHGEDDRLVRHRLHHVLRHRALCGQAKENIGPDQSVGKRARFGPDREARFPLVHAIGAAFVDHAFGVAQDQIFRAEADRAQQFEAGDAGGAGAVAHQLRGGDVAAGQLQRVDQAGRGDDGGAVLVIVEHRNVEQFAQSLLDDETFRRLDVLEVDAAPAFAEQFDTVDELVRILGRDLQIDRSRRRRSA